jgi:hypothetical protein
MLFHEFEQLPDLIRFGFTADVLQINQPRHTGAREDVMTSARADMTKAKRFGQLQSLGEAQVVWALQRLPQQLAGIHGD